LAIPSEIAKELTLDLTDIPRDRRKQAKEEVGEFVVGEILRYVSSGNSPVSGRGKFQRLQSGYADKEKGGLRTANLELDGDMLDALQARNTVDGIKVGIFKSSQVPKADGHNDFSGESKLPTRRFIPDGGEGFKRSINSGVKQILEQYKEVEKPQSQLPSALALGQAAVTSESTLDDVLSPFLTGLFDE